MLNYETIKSVYDDKLTLMQWLKKVEEALKNATAVEFKVNKRGSATLTFSIVFDDGTELETSDIVLQQGESVTGAAIVSGHLILTLSNGDTLDAGDLGGVSSFSIDASQHLIVHYQNGSTQGLGAIFSGNITIAGPLTATGKIKSNDNIEADGDIEAGGALKGASAAITGKVTGAEIIENMTGYSFVPATPADVTLEYVYVGIVKNGNKLTFVIAANVTKLDAGVSQIGLGDINCPNSVMDKLFPTNVGIYPFLDNKKITIFDNYYSGVEIFAYTEKGGYPDRLVCRIGNSSNMVVNTKYFLRYEATFLLSENLAA